MLRQIKINLALMARGGTQFGIFQAFGLVSFNQIFFTFLVTLFGALVTAAVSGAFGTTTA